MQYVKGVKNWWSITQKLNMKEGLPTLSLNVLNVAMRRKVVLTIFTMGMMVKNNSI